MAECTANQQVSFACALNGIDLIVWKGVENAKRRSASSVQFKYVVVCTEDERIASMADGQSGNPGLVGKNGLNDFPFDVELPNRIVVFIGNKCKCVTDFYLPGPQE